MAKFPSLGDAGNVVAILKMNPEVGAPLIAMHEALLRGPSPLSVAERELIAALVSGLNRCRYCFGMHAAAAVALGYDAALVARLVEDPSHDGVEARLKPVLTYARKLTLAPDSVIDADAAAVYAEGWSERALHDAIMVTATFNFMNRVLEGHGAHGSDKMFAERGPIIAKHGYAPLIAMIAPKGAAADA